VRIRLSVLFLFGFTVHLVELGYFYFLPLNFVDQVLLTLAAPFLCVMTLCTGVMGFFLREIEKNRVVDRLMDESEQRLETLFDSASIALIEEDMSRVMARLTEIRESGVTDLREYLDANPDQVTAMITSVKITNANKFAIDLFKAPSAIELIGNIGKYLGPGAREMFIDRLLAFWNGDSKIVRETELKRSDGVRLYCGETVLYCVHAGAENGGRSEECPCQRY